MSEDTVKQARLKIDAIISNIERVIIGKRNVVELCVFALLCGGHVLIEDVPGVGKTSLVSALAKTVSCGFKRIQFTPDVMPSDITGFSVYNRKSGDFEFRPGAVMSNIILADEINRASARTQSSLLEAMEECRVTVDTVTYKLEEPFMVLATQNPVESFGTYPLPEAQIDRFLMKLSIGYPSPAEEAQIALASSAAREELSAVISREDVAELRSAAEQIHVSNEVTQYAVALAAATRSNPDVKLGSSPRGTIALIKAGKVRALYSGRGYVLPDDIKFLAPYVLSHRIMLGNEAKLKGRSGLDIVNDTINSVIVPINAVS